MSGFDQLTALLNRSAADPRPNLVDQLAEAAANDDAEITPGAAIAAAIGIWLEEHWPAILLGFATGLTAIALPALVAARVAS